MRVRDPTTPFREIELLAALNPLEKRFNIHRRLGEGGFGVVLEAYDTYLERHVAIKFLKPDIRAQEEEVQRFLKEARALAALKHPHIVQVYDLQMDSSLGPYMIMEYLSGQTLRDYLNEHGPLSLQQTVRLLRPIAEALDYIHEKKWVHRDVKPHNIFLEMKRTKTPEEQLCGRSWEISG
ncbi:MAG: serine/threonine-protein kinase [Ardenticatenia bacterium]|nr:serine/threonine-protein kinase [Ardenticatenia bacterium]